MTATLACLSTFFATLAVFSSLTYAAPAHAEARESALVLRWDAPEPCPNGAAVRAQVLGLASLDSRSVHRLEAYGTIETDGQIWHLVLRTRFEDTPGERRLSASSCRELTDAAVVMMALILNPESEAKARKRAAPTGPRPVSHAPSQLRLQSLVDLHAGFHA